MKNILILKNILIEMKPNMEKLKFKINDTIFTFPIPESIKNILPFANKYKIFCKMFYKDEAGKIKLMIMQYTDDKGNIVFEEKDWSLCI